MEAKISLQAKPTPWDGNCGYPRPEQPQNRNPEAEADDKVADEVSFSGVRVTSD